MTSGQFQPESERRFRAADTSALAQRLSKSQPPTSIVAALLQLHLTGQLDQGGQQALDDLFSPPAIAFLLHGQQSIHPYGIQLFPVEILETALQASSQAVFVQHHRDGNRFCGRDYEIQVGRIGRLDASPLVLGMIVPWVLQPEKYRQEFRRALAEARRANEAAATAAQVIKSLDTDAHPLILFARPSGTVIWANRPAQRIANKKTHVQAGLDWDQVAAILAETLKSQAVRVHNSDAPGCEWVLMELLPRPTETDLADPAIRLVSGLHYRANSITKTAKSLEAIGDPVRGKPDTELLRIIIEEALALETQLLELQHVLDQRDPEHISLPNLNRLVVSEQIDSPACALPSSIDRQGDIDELIDTEKVYAEYV